MIETRRLRLRHFTLDDVEKVFFMSIEESMKKGIPNQVYESMEESREVVEFLMSQYDTLPSEKEALYVLGIEVKETEELIGHVGLSTYPDGIEIGYAIEEKEQGKGYGTEAVAGISEWATKDLKIQKIYGSVIEENFVSCKLVEKVGYEYLKTEAGRKIYVFS